MKQAIDKISLTEMEFKDILNWYHYLNLKGGEELEQVVSIETFPLDSFEIEIIPNRAFLNQEWMNINRHSQIGISERAVSIIKKFFDLDEANLTDIERHEKWKEYLRDQHNLYEPRLRKLQQELMKIQNSSESFDVRANKWIEKVTELDIYPGYSIIVDLNREDFGKTLFSTYSYLNFTTIKTGIYSMTINDAIPLTSKKDNGVQIYLNALLSVMAYIQKTQNYTTKMISRREVRKQKKSGSKHKNTYRPVTINQRVIYLTMPTNHKDKLRSYERHIDSWGVRGHWRTYKSGKKVWIKPQVRGNGKYAAKTYSINTDTISI